MTASRSDRNVFRGYSDRPFHFGTQRQPRKSAANRSRKNLEQQIASNFFRLTRANRSHKAVYVELKNKRRRRNKRFIHVPKRREKDARNSIY